MGAPASALTERISRWKSFDLDGGHTVLDLANTVDWRGTPKARDRLAEPADLLVWGQRVGLLTIEQMEQGYEELVREPERARQTLARAVELRETLVRILEDVSRDVAPQPDDWDRFNTALGRALSLVTCVPAPPRGAPGSPRFRLAFRDTVGYPERILHEVARSAGELLSGSDLGRIKRCGSEDCGWLFLDRTKNRSRKWCSMEGCGNRAKAQRHYRKVKVDVRVVVRPPRPSPPT